MFLKLYLSVCMSAGPMALSYISVGVGRVLMKLGRLIQNMSNKLYQNFMELGLVMASSL